MVVDRSEYFLRRDEQAGHFPYRHFEIHLREFEQSGEYVLASAIGYERIFGVFFLDSPLCCIAERSGK